MPNGGVNKLLYPLFLYSLIGWFIHCINLLHNEDYNYIHYFLTPIKEFVKIGAIQGNLPLWFITFLFLVKIVHCFFTHINLHNWRIASIGVLVAYILYSCDNPVPFYFRNVWLGLFFFSTGSLLRNAHKETIMTTLAFGTYIAFIVLGIPFVGMKENTLVEGSWLLWFPFAIAGCVCANAIGTLTDYKFPVLSWIGKNSMTIIVTHCLVLQTTGIITTVVQANTIKIFNSSDIGLLEVMILFIVEPILITIVTKHPRFIVYNKRS